MRNKFAYSCSVKIYALGFNKLLESIFCLLLIVEAFSLQQVVKMFEEVVVSWQDLGWIWQMRQNFVAQFVKLLKHWSWDMWSVTSWRRTGPFLLTSASCRPCSSQCFLLSMLLRCNGFAGIQKAVWIRQAADHQTGTMTFFLVQVWLWKCFGASSWSSHLAGHRFLPQVTIDWEMVCCCKRRWHFTKTIFFFSQLLRHPLIKPFHLCHLLQMPNDHRMVNVEFLSDFSYSFNKIIVFKQNQLQWSSQLSTSEGQPLSSSFSRLLSPLQNFLNHHCTILLLTVPKPNALML